MNNFGVHLYTNDSEESDKARTLLEESEIPFKETSTKDGIRFEKGWTLPSIWTIHGEYHTLQGIEQWIEEWVDPSPDSSN